jgi:Tfp pilus assembly protein PilF
MVQRRTTLLVVFSILLISACGPDTIFLRPGLDTPTQHVKNGHNLLSRGKIDAAQAEFERARSLDESYVPAYVGIALVQGHRGDVANGLETLDQAKSLAKTTEDTETVAKGYERLQGMQSTVNN